MVRDATTSVLEQTHRNVEVIVVDDGSTDGSADSIRDIQDPRLRVLRQENSGLSSARNTGLSLATGEYIAFLDADDIWYPTELEHTLPHLNAHAAVGSRMQYVGEDGTLARGFAGQDPAQDQEAIRAGLFMPFPFSSIVFRREAVLRAGLFDRSLAKVEDLDFLLRVARDGSVGWVPTALGAYRLRAGAMSAAKFIEQRMYARFVEYRAVARDWGQDLEWAELEADYRLSPKELRAEEGAARYRRADLLLANRDYRGVLLLLGAIATAPRYATGRLLRQL